MRLCGRCRRAISLSALWPQGSQQATRFPSLQSGASGTTCTTRVACEAHPGQSILQYRRSRSMTRARPTRKSREYNMTVRAASAEAWYVATDGEGIPRTRPIPGVPRFSTSTVRRAESISSKPGTVDSPDRDSARRTVSPEGDTDARRRPLPDPRSRARVSRTGRGLFSIHPANVARWLR